MPAKITGDYSKLPATIQSVFPYLEGETCQLHEYWATYEHLFMLDPRWTKFFSERFGPLLVVLQHLLVDEMFLTISRLTDKNSRSQDNLSLWSLLQGVPFAKNASFETEVDVALENIATIAASIRTHRHKRIAHFDLEVSLKSGLLPTVKFKEIKTLLNRIDEFINLFHAEFEDSSFLFDIIQNEITGVAEINMWKAFAYDQLEKNGMVPKLEWLAIKNQHIAESALSDGK